MDLKAELEALRERRFTLEDTLEDIDYQIEKAMHAVAAGTSDVGHALGVLESRRNDHSGLMFELGMVTAQIEELEGRILEQDERGREDAAVQEGQEHAPAAEEDHLDWLRPALEAQDPELKQVQEREQRQEVEEREQEDHLDWLKR